MRKGRREIGSNVSIMRGERLNQVHFQYHRINQDLQLVRIRYLECVYLSSYRHYNLFFMALVLCYGNSTTVSRC